VPTFVLLVNWTEQGIQGFEDTEERSDQTAELLRGFGGELKHMYWTLGAYDLVAVAEAPSAERMAAFALALGRGGNVRTMTLPAFSKETILEVVEDAKLHGGKLHGGQAPGS
jgi:uncharacterized protein with GYD domain